MKKLIRGILDFRKNVLPAQQEKFAWLAVGQAPDVLFITCSDSRVAPNWFASTDPGDLFVIRNVGNLVPPYNPSSGAASDHSVGAAIEFSLLSLRVSDIVVCGHSGCGGVHALAKGIDRLPPSNLKQWLTFADTRTAGASPALEAGPDLSSEDKLSQEHALQQIENLKTYPVIRERFDKKELRLHAWWFDIAQAGVFAYDKRSHSFVLIDDKFGETLLADNS